MNSTQISSDPHACLTARRFENQIALVTGGNSGLGLAITRRLVAEGAQVTAMALDEGNFDEIEVESEGRVTCRQLDVTDAAQVAAVVAETVERCGRIDVLVNSAGVTGQTNRKSHEVDVKDLEFVLQTNVIGSFLMAKAVLPIMLRQSYGRILNIASIAGKDGNAGMLAYSASKAAVIGMTKVQGKDYAETGVTVNALAPAVIQTPMVDALPEDQVRYMTDKIPMKRCGSLEEFAAMAAFITSREASFTTGFTFDLTGGRAVY